MKCDGVVQILRYNAHFYGAAIATLAAAAVAAVLHVGPLPAIAAAAGVTALFTLSSLAVSWYVYDCARVTRWRWMEGLLPSAPRRWLNIHAGLDESTEALAQMYRGTEYAVVDIYDCREMTEPSIARARRIRRGGREAARARLGALPFPSATQDAVFLLLTAHEVRRHDRRVALLREGARTLSPGGRVVLVEHLRDWKNFVAFGPGFLHFYSRADWLRAASEAGLAVERESAVTPFVRCWLLRGNSLL